MLTQKDSSMSGFSRLASMFRLCCSEHFRMRSSVPSIISAMAGIVSAVDSIWYTVDGAANLLGGDGQYNIKNQRRQHRAVPSLHSGQALAAAKAHQPG